MDLHRIVSGAIGAVNPHVPIAIRFSTGWTREADGKRVPSYATPGALVGSIAGTTLTVTSVTLGKLLPGQLLIGAAYGTIVAEQLTGAEGGTGTYRVSTEQTLVSGPLTTSFMMRGQIQPLTFRDLQMIDAVNVQGTQRAIYVSGHVNGLVRIARKGGDLIITPDNRVWLVTLVLEQWPDWVKVAVTLQDETA